MKALISKQYIMMDSHNCGCEPSMNGVHIHKKSKEFSEDVYEIRIPLQTDREVSINCVNGVGHVPSKIKKEVQKVLKDKKKRSEFFNEVFENLMKFKWERDEQEEKILVSKIAAVFGLKKTDYDKSTSQSTASYIMTDEGNTRFQIVLNYETQKVYVGELVEDWQPELNF